jgi:nucleoside 2-deoxyribosyltransferase
MIRIYLAGPDVFLPDAAAVGRAKQAICARHGLVGLYPLDGERPGEAPSGPDAGLAIALANEAKMHEADAIIANLSPFRGPSADVGTAYELGFMRALGKPCFGYSNDLRAFVERVEAFIGEPLGRLSDGRLVGADGLTAESFGLADNLMLHAAVGLDGWVAVAEPGLAASQAFARCVALAAGRLAGRARD